MSQQRKSSTAFQCLSCDNGSTKVVDSRAKTDPNNGEDYVHRVRRCPACGMAFDTEERVAKPRNLRYYG